MAIDGAGAIEGVGQDGAGEAFRRRSGGERPPLLDDQNVVDPRADLLDVVRNVNERGGVGPHGQPGQVAEEAFPGRRVQARARLVEDQQRRPVDQGAGNEHPLLFALRKLVKRLIDEGLAAEKLQDLTGAGPLGVGELAVQAERGLEAGGHDFQGGILPRQVDFEGRAHPADGLPQLGQTALAELPAQDAHRAFGGPFVAGDDLEQGCLARPVGPEQSPVLTGGDGPGDVGENCAAAADKAYFL